jgi:hypothetical protein
MANDVTDLLDALYARKISLKEVVARFRGGTWPFDLGADADNSGTYEDVVAAYEQGRLTEDQYGQLLEAIAEAQSDAAGM